MRVAALYDVHGMMDALEAVLAEVERAKVDAVVVGGDVVAGPQPVETLERLRGLELDAYWIRGNGDRALGPDGVAAVSRGEEGAEALAWTSGRLTPADRAFLAGLPTTLTLELSGLGPTLFCHGTPASDLELITSGTPEEILRRAVNGIDESVVVSGHTHMQFDRRVDGTRWVNAGSVGWPFEGGVGAFWALLGPDVELRRTGFDVDSAATVLLHSGWPPAELFVAENLRAAPSREETIQLFEQIARERGER